MLPTENQKSIGPGSGISLANGDDRYQRWSLAWTVDRHRGGIGIHHLLIKAVVQTHLGDIIFHPRIEHGQMMLKLIGVGVEIRPVQSDLAKVLAFRPGDKDERASAVALGA